MVWIKFQKLAIPVGNITIVVTWMYQRLCHSFLKFGSPGIDFLSCHLLCKLGISVLFCQDFNIKNCGLLYTVQDDWWHHWRVVCGMLSNSSLRPDISFSAYIGLPCSRENTRIPRRPIRLSTIAVTLQLCMRALVQTKHALINTISDLK